jgi:hypothetical protein
VNPVGRLALTFLLVICDIAAFSAPARAQQPVPPGQGQTIPPFQQSPVEPPFSPLSGPYTPPPTEALPGQPPPPPPFMKKGGRAALPAAQEERFVLTPSILIDEAYTDNVFLDNDFMRSGFITSFTPGLLLGFRMPDFGVGVGYVFTSEIYAKETELNDALARWGASVAAFYDLTPRLRLNFEAAYFEDNNTTASGIAGISTGRTNSRGAAASPALTWQFDPLTRIQLSAACQSGHHRRLPTPRDESRQQERHGPVVEDEGAKYGNGNPRPHSASGDRPHRVRNERHEHQNRHQQRGQRGSEEANAQPLALQGLQDQSLGERRHDYSSISTQCWGSAVTNTSSPSARGSVAAERTMSWRPSQST